MLLATIGYYMSALILILAPAPEQGMAYSFFVTFNYICFIPLLTIPLALLFFPQILYGIPILRLSGDDKASVVSINGSTEQKLIPEEREHARQEEMPVADEQIEEGLVESAQTIMEYIKKEKPYLDKDFSMDKLAQAMQLPRHHIYFCMNRVLKVKFPELRKQLRIQHARHLLEEGKNKTLSIEGIGIQSGFSSRSNFFTAFKSEVGCTPSEYLERLSAG
jgi:AraC-like DNA-binding protein